MATNNAHKVAEFRRMLGEVGYRMVSPGELGLRLEVEEDADSFWANAAQKAHAFAQASGLMSLADDSGLEVDALGGVPGVHSARYGGLGLTDEGRMQLLLRRMQGVPWEHRACRYRAALVIAWPHGRQEGFEGVCEGTVANEPAGTNGFGYDSIFYVPGSGQTMAQLTETGKDAISHRGHAARQVAELLRPLAEAEQIQ